MCCCVCEQAREPCPGLLTSDVCVLCALVSEHVSVVAILEETDRKRKKKREREINSKTEREIEREREGERVRERMANLPQS